MKLVEWSKVKRSRLAKAYAKQEFEQWFKHFLEEAELRHAGYGRVSIMGQEMAPSQIFLYIQCEFSRIFDLVSATDSRLKKPSERSLERALDVFLETLPESGIAEVSETLKFTSESSSPDEYLSLLVESPSELDKAVFRHWLWQVKRKAAGLTVPNPLWLNLFGKQGSGKTCSLNHLLEPLASFVRHTNAYEATDDRAFHSYAQTLVLFLDELSGSAKAEVEKIKQLTTASHLSARRLGTHKVDSIQNRASFLSATNVNLSTLIKDPTGARRFFELTSRDRMDIQAVLAFDVTSVWKAIDENADSPLKGHEEALAEAQEEIRHETPLEMWWDQRQLGDCQVQKLTAAQLLADFEEWATAHKFRAESYHRLAAFLKNQDTRKARTAAGTVYELSWPAQQKRYAL